MGKDIFDEIGGQRTSGGGNYIKDGRYELIVNQLKFEELEAGPTFIAEFRVKASAPSTEVGADGLPVKPNTVGSECSYIQQPKKFKSAGGNIKAFMQGLLDKVYGTDEASIAEFKKDMQTVLGEKQPARGLVVKVETYRKLIKGGPNKDKPLTLVKWIHVPGQDKASKATNRAILDAAAPADSADSAAEDEIDA